MTIAVGFLCPDGVVLASDTLIRKEGDLKYNEAKLFPIVASGKKPWALAFTYAGDPDQMKVVHEDVSSRLPSSESPLTCAAVRETVQKVLTDRYKQFRSRFNLETLCGISIPGQANLLLVTKNDLVREATAECLGVGDSALVKYLCALLIPICFNTSHAALVSGYIVKQAKNFTDGCGGDTLSLTLRDGQIFHGEAGLLEDLATDMEYEIKRLLLALSDLPVKEATLSSSLDAFSHAVKEIYRRGPTSGGGIAISGKL